MATASYAPQSSSSEMGRAYESSEAETRSKGKGKAREMGPSDDEQSAVLLQRLYDAGIPESLGSEVFSDPLTQETVRFLLDKVQKAEEAQAALQQKVNELQRRLFIKVTGMKKREITPPHNPGELKRIRSRDGSAQIREVDPRPRPAPYEEAVASGVSGGEEVVAHNSGPPQIEQMVAHNDGPPPQEEEDEAEYFSYPHFEIQEYLRDPPHAEPLVVVEFPDLSEFMAKGLTPVGPVAELATSRQLTQTLRYATQNNLDSVTHSLYPALLPTDAITDAIQGEGPGGDDDDDDGFESNSDGKYDTPSESETRAQRNIREAKKAKQARRRETEKAQKAAFDRKWDSKNPGNIPSGWLTT
ncbi:hypothetical protein H0H92_010895, partial [Tricholoma furcatifolium]